MYLILAIYLILCGIVTYIFSSKENGFTKMILLVFFLSPIGGIILGLRNRADLKMKNRSVSLKQP